jgi:hypothetical protein
MTAASSSRPGLTRFKSSGGSSLGRHPILSSHASAIIHYQIKNPTAVIAKHAENKYFLLCVLRALCGESLALQVFFHGLRDLFATRHGFHHRGGTVHEIPCSKNSFHTGAHTIRIDC